MGLLRVGLLFHSKFQLMKDVMNILNIKNTAGTGGAHGLKPDSFQNKRGYSNSYRTPKKKATLEVALLSGLNVKRHKAHQTQ